MVADEGVEHVLYEVALRLRGRWRRKILRVPV
jgi:hypothetical protein